MLQLTQDFVERTCKEKLLDFRVARLHQIEALEISLFRNPDY